MNKLKHIMNFCYKTKFSIAYKIVTAIVILTAIFHRAGLFGTELQLHTLYSFTTISNGIVFTLTLVTLFTTIYNKPSSVNLLQLRAVGLMMILVTGLTYHYILLPQKIAENHSYNVFTYGNIIAHYIAPTATFFDWLLFDEKGKIKSHFPLICLLVPLIYFVVFSIYGFYGSTIPNKQTSYVYFFMDFGEIGLAGVMKWIFIMLGLILLLAYLIYFLDYIISKKKLQ